MKKNIVFFTAMEEAPDNMEYKQWCYNSWQYWCAKHDVEIFILDTPLTDKNLMKPTWQRWHVFDILDANGIEYDQVALVDVDTMVKWDAPNFFEQTQKEFSAIEDCFYIEWSHNSIKGYQHLFPDTKFDWTTYFNCGFVVVNEKHKSLCKSITDFYYENMDHLRDLQHNTLKKGSDQTPVNYLVRREGFPITYLDKKFNLSQLHTRGVLNDLMFETGYVWHFNGFEKTMRNQIMEQTWNAIKNNYV
jgi:hypothetical protein